MTCFSEIGASQHGLRRRKQRFSCEDFFIFACGRANKSNKGDCPLFCFRMKQQHSSMCHVPVYRGHKKNGDWLSERGDCWQSRFQRDVPVPDFSRMPDETREKYLAVKAGKQPVPRRKRTSSIVTPRKKGFSPRRRFSGAILYLLESLPWIW